MRRPRQEEGRFEPEFKQVQQSALLSLNLCLGGGSGLRDGRKLGVSRRQQEMVSRKESSGYGYSWDTVCLWEALGAVPELKKRGRGELCDVKIHLSGLAHKDIGASWLGQPY